MKSNQMLVTLVLMLTLSACSVFQPDNSQTGLSASGVVAGTNINVASELGGKVSEVYVDEGDSVEAGDLLFKLDCSLLQGQGDVAQAVVDSADSALQTAQSALALTRAQYDAALTAARAQEGAARLADWDKRTPNYFEQPNWYFSREEQIAAAQANVGTAQQRFEQARANLDKVTRSLDNADFVAAEMRLANARTNYLIAKSVDSHAQATGGKVRPEDIDVNLPPYAPSYRIKIAIAHDLSGESDILNVSQDDLDAARTELDNAEKEYGDLLGTKAAERVQEARAELSVAKERYEVSLDTLNKLQTGEYSPQVKIASLALDQAKDGVQQAQSGLGQAQAALKLNGLQMEKCTVKVPQAGVVTSRSLESGEIIAPGGTVMVISQLNPLTLTVYMPEDRYGQVKLGQQVSIRVDSFPGQTFTGTVKFIASEGEFTPRNVQTVDGRKATVYAVRIEVQNKEGLLKPGMAADVSFIQ